MRVGINLKLFAVFLGLLLLMGLAIMATFLTLNAQKSDGVVINLAGKQRMLSQKMTKEALGVSQDIEKVESLKKTSALFDKTLKGLISGDSGLGLPPTKAPHILTQLNAISGIWKGFKKNLDVVAANAYDRNVSLAYINSNNVDLLKKLNEAVLLMERAKLPAKVINLAGRQRMLSQKMTKEALLLSQGKLDKKVLSATLNSFDRTHKALLRGNRKLGVEAIKEKAIRAKLGEVETLWGAFKESVESVVEGSAVINSAINYLKNNNLKLLKNMNAAVGMYEKEATKGVGRLKTMQLVFLLLAVIAAVGGSIILSRLIVSPLVKVAEFAKQFGDGDLTANLQITSKDEIGDMATSLADMAKNLREIISNIMESSNSIASASEEISSTTEQLAAGTDNQYRQTGEVASAMEEMATSVQGTFTNAERSLKVSKKTSETASQGGEIISRTMSGMARIEQSVSDSAAKIQRLGERSKHIGQIVEVIKEIAAQTNLLALNAAIEASRAGEHGRGFEVVAEEIRKLAEKSADSTLQITEIVGEIQSETSFAVDSMSDVTREVEEGTTLSNDTGEALGEIIRQVKETVNSIEMVTEASRQQAAVSDEVAASMESISSVVKESAASAEEIANTAQELARLGDDLRRITERFKV